jgi:hypothetical protein
MADSEPIVSTKRCVNIRWKELHVYGEHDLEFQQQQQAEPICWCVKTQYCMGPDGMLAGRSECDPSRSCYEPL